MKMDFSIMQIGGESQRILKLALDKIQKIKGLKGEFLLGTCYEQGPLPIQRCTVLSVYYREEGKNIILYRWRACAVGPDMDATYDEAYSEVLSYLILNWEEVWNLINSKLR